MCQTLEPQMVMNFLNDLFTRFDRRLEAFDVYKVRGAVSAAVGYCHLGHPCATWGGGAQRLSTPLARPWLPYPTHFKTLVPNQAPETVYSRMSTKYVVVCGSMWGRGGSARAP